MMSAPPRHTIASGHLEVTKAAREVLLAGGNAFDAAVAAGFCSAVCEPALTSLGGGGFMLAKPEGQEPILFDFFVDTPGLGLLAGESRTPHFEPVTVAFKGASQVFNIGWGSAAVPGSVAGLLHIHRRLGRMPLHDVTAKARQLARDGIPLEPLQAYTLELLHPILSACDEGRALFGPEGVPLRTGQVIKNEKTADFLENLPESADSLYRGDIARELAALMRAHGGLLTEKDLAAYAVAERKPFSHRYRGHTLLSNAPPALGGSLLGLSLALLEGTDLTKVAFGSDGHHAALGITMAEVEGLRKRGITSPAMLDDEALRRAREPVRTSSGGTTHLTVADAFGNVASMTTSNGEGSGHFIPHTGIMINNMLGEDDLHPEGFHAGTAGVRVSSMMSPSLVLGPDGTPVLALGSGGSKRIRTALFQVISHVVDYHLAIEDAVRRPRIHFDGEGFQVEGGLESASLDTLRAKYPVNVWEDLDLYFGGVHAVVPLVDAGADPRRGGSSASFGVDVDEGA